MYSKNNELAKYENESKNNAPIMEYERDSVIKYLESEKKYALESLDTTINNKNSYISKDIILALGWLLAIGSSLYTKFFSYSVIYSCAFIISSILNIIRIKKFNNDIKGYESQLQFLEERLKEETEKYKDKEKEIIIENSEKSEGELEKQIGEIGRQSNLYFDMGINKKRLAKYYKLGMLTENLNKIFERYNESDIKLVENYLEEKGQAKAKTNK